MFKFFVQFFSLLQMRRLISLKVFTDSFDRSHFHFFIPHPYAFFKLLHNIFLGDTFSRNQINEYHYTALHNDKTNLNFMFNWSAEFCTYRTLVPFSELRFQDLNIYTNVDRQIVDVLYVGTIKKLQLYLFYHCFL